MSYVGRFAPSPTGPLHAGSLLAAVGSWLDARSHAGAWHLRVDDLDRFRCRPEFESMQCATLAAFGLQPFSRDGSHAPWRQSERLGAYASAIETLRCRVPIFACDCTRRDRLAEGEDGCLRDCRTRRVDPAGAAWRADLTALAPAVVEDRSLGPIRFDPAVHRDVIVRRRDGLPAYALAVVIDDAARGVTDVVRGGDLLAGTSWQLGLHQALDLKPPRYLHLPVVLEPDGRKLAKSRHAVALDPNAVLIGLLRALQRLRQATPTAQATVETTSTTTQHDMTPQELLEWASARWRPDAFAGLAAVTVETDGR